MIKPYITKHLWSEFHINLRGYDIFWGDFKQMKWWIFYIEDNDEIGRIMDRTSTKYTITTRQDWHDKYGGLTEGVIN